MIVNQTENNYAFIDSGNLYLAMRDQGWRLNEEKFRVYLKDKYHITKAYLFMGYLPTQQTLYTNLQKKGYIVIFKPTLMLPSGKPKGNTDAELVLHTMIEYPNYDKAVIVTGDGDYFCLIEYLKKQDKLKKLLIPNRYDYSQLLTKFVPDMAYVTDLKEKLEFK